MRRPRAPLPAPPCPLLALLDSLRWALRAGGHDVRHVLLDKSSEELRYRITGAPARRAGGQRVRAWRQAHVAEYERERPRLMAAADLVVDTTRRCSVEVAATLLTGLSVCPREGFTLGSPQELVMLRKV